MKGFFSRFSKKSLLGAALVVSAFGITAVAHAWGPDRPTYTVNNPADHVTFNSITDNPDYGDERTFFDGKDATNTNAGGFVDTVNVKDGEEVLLRVYVHNNAATSLNTVSDGHGGYKGVATGSKVRIFLPTATADALRANAYISANNASPAEVNDTLNFNAATPFSLSYVPGSATMYTNAVPKGFALSDSIVAGGASVGYAGADGVIPGCFQYTGIVTIKVKVSMPHYELQKKVSLDGKDTFSKSVTAQPGGKVQYVLAFKNDGSTTLNNVVVGDRLPSGVTYVKGSTQYISSATGNKWVASSSDNVTVGGLNIGSFLAGGAGYVKFTAQLPNKDALKCGMNELVNTGFAKPEGYGTVQDTATVDISKTCEETPAYSCDLLTLTKGDNRTVTASVAYTATNGAALKLVTYNFGDNSTPLTTDKTTATHTYTADGTYTVNATLTFSVKGADKTGVTSQSCSQKVTFGSNVPPVPPVLPNTGAGSVIGIFAGVVTAATIGYRLFLSRKLAARQ